jgi:glycosyltransferase involved in cell wall biosynthesis
MDLAKAGLELQNYPNFKYFMKLSIICSTFNHEKYITACIDSFLMQKVDFSYEVLIHDDASTDNTQNIIEVYKKKYPNIIKPILQTENQYQLGKNNWSEYQFPRAKGKYIALCEGDDYWTDPYKLQKQVNFLENNEDFASVFHPVDWLIQNTNTLTKGAYIPPIKKEYYTKLDLLEHCNFIPTCSVIFRNRKDLIPSWFSEIVIGDFVIHLLNCEYGKHGFINQSMAVYRNHSTGLYSSQTTIQNKTTLAITYEKLNKYLKFSDKEINYANRYLSKIYFYLSDYFFHKDKTKSLFYLKKAGKANYDKATVENQLLKLKYPWILEFNEDLKFLNQNKAILFTKKLIKKLLLKIV